MKKLLGVLGGMGPLASIRFYELLIQKSINVYGVKNNADFPHILIDNIAVPDLVTSKDNEEKTVALVEAEARRMARAGATAFAMSCNTLHLYTDTFQRAADIPFISMIDAVVERVKKDGRKNVGLLGSVTTMQSSLYINPLEAAGVHVIIPRIAEQSALGTLIHSVIGGQAGLAQKNQLTAAISSLVEQGSEAVILGCTELPLLMGGQTMPISVYDSLDILADRCCEYLFIDR